ncbi:MAG: ATP-dependent DNA helicase [Deltaproteobacteria bacterium]|nr:ATP-dependent DNA helicase [Deltaproteobacteria bacterium]
MQVKMTEAVEDAIARGGVLLAEAGTGTGKTLAYLAPAILSDRTVIISTGTKNLQEQVYFKDLAFLEGALGMSLNTVYLKGQDNYVCLRRLDEFMRSPKVLSQAPEKVTELTQWAASTETGDRMELEGLSDDDPMWREICSTRETRVGTKCRFAPECFVTKARLQAMQAQLVVVNHHLYFADLATRFKGGSILPDHDVVVFDEAHVIEDVATEFFSTSVSSARIDRALTSVLATVRGAKLQDDPAEDRRRNLVDAARASSSELLLLFRGNQGRVRLVPEEIESRHLEAYYRTDAALDAVWQSLRLIEGRDEAVDQVAERVGHIRNDLSIVLSQTAKGFVHWVENRKRAVIVGASPIDVSETLREGVFFSVPTVILTSATLSTGGDFSFLKSRLGLDFDVVELSLPSPFDYEKQARIYLPDHLPDPRNASFLVEAATDSEKLIDISKGGALLLFTSLKNMRAMHAILAERISYPLLLQGEAPKSTLLARFMETPNAVLCATSSFWQGVDIPGDALRLVIIDKLPFSSPGDPLVAARIEHLQAEGHKPFIEYQVPEAALSLKQGFGRLIRTGYDRGIVAILDRRLHTMAYAAAFLRSLPACPGLTEIGDVDAWWRTTTGSG